MQEKQSKKRFQILSLDGGGLKGLFTAAFLANWEKEQRTRVVEHFDLIAGTSTGGIIALGLGLGFSAEEIKNLYLEKAEQIFPPEPPRKREALDQRQIFRRGTQSRPR